MFTRTYLENQIAKLMAKDTEKVLTKYLTGRRSPNRFKAMLRRLKRRGDKLMRQLNKLPFNDMNELDYPESTIEEEIAQTPWWKRIIGG